jgi:hypothetical protein
MNNYTDENGHIFCPDDGLIAKSISELKLLNNLIIGEKGTERGDKGTERGTEREIDNLETTNRGSVN